MLTPDAASRWEIHTIERRFFVRAGQPFVDLTNRNIQGSN
jgi:hypothetical protein